MLIKYINTPPISNTQPLVLSLMHYYLPLCPSGQRKTSAHARAGWISIWSWSWRSGPTWIARRGISASRQLCRARSRKRRWTPESEMYFLELEKLLPVTVLLRLLVLLVLTHQLFRVLFFRFRGHPNIIWIINKSWYKMVKSELKIQYYTN